jgi:hypothetical protein
MRKFHGLKKVLLFGALGALGCLLGSGIGEVFLREAIPWANATEGVSTPSILTPPEPPQPEATDKAGIREEMAVRAPEPPESFKPVKPPEPPPLGAEFTTRLDREGAHQGDVVIALIWWNRTDLDLHVIDPAGEEIWYGHRKSQLGGELDVDMNVNGESDTPVEHVYFPEGGAPGGHYKVFAVCYTDRSAEPNAYKVGVQANGQTREYQGSISNTGKIYRSQDLVCEFDVTAPSPQLRLSVPERVSVLLGDSNQFRVRIARGYFDGPVTVGLESGGGLTFDDVEIPPSETTGTVTLNARGSVSAGIRKLQVVASADRPQGRVVAAAGMWVTVIPKIEPVIKLAVPGTMQILQGDSNRFKARVGRYFFSSVLPVTVSLDPEDSDLKSERILIPAASDETVIEVEANRNARPGIHNVRVIAKTNSPATEATGTMAVDVVPLPLPRFGWATILIVAVWTALLGIGLSFLLAIGQNRYLKRPLMSLHEAVPLLVGGLAAGSISGGGGQLLHAWLGRMQAQAGGEISPEVGQVAGWCILGLLLGYGVGFYVPNLSRSRAALAGLIGGLLGSGGFLAFTYLNGDMVGRIAGGMVLGFAIGSMVALVEAVFREAWLEIRYGPKEARTVSLGREPVSLGSNQSICTVYAVNAPPVAYRYWLKENAIFCEDVAAGRTMVAVPGDRKQIGNLVATVCAGGTVATADPDRRMKIAGAEFLLRLSNGRKIVLNNGASLTVKDLPGLHSVPPGGPVAVVSNHPTDPAIRGLQNLSNLVWQVRLPNGDSIEVKSGKNVRIATGTRIRFGAIEGEIK